MKGTLKNSQVFGIIGVCAVILIVLFSQSSQSPQVAEIIVPQGQVAQAASATFTLSPAATSVAVNGTFTVSVILNTGGQQIYGVDLNKIRFNPAILQVVDADGVTAGVQITAGTLMPLVFVNTVDNTAGTVQFSQVANPGTTYSGSGTVASITFRAIAAGTSAVTIDFSAGSGTDSNIAGLGGDLLTSVLNGSYTGTVTDSTPPSTPGTPTLTVNSSSQISLAWTASTDNVAVTGYRIERCVGSATCVSFSQIGTSVAASYVDSGLSASTIYRYRIFAVDAIGNVSTASVAANATTQAPPDTTPPTISAVAFTGLTTTSVTITWTTNENADTQVDYGLTNAYGLSSTLNTTLATSHSVTLSGLSPGTSYHYRVKSKDAAGNPSNSLDNVFTTTAGADTTAPTIPTGVTANATGETQVQLSWNASTDPTVAGQNSSGVASYQIYRGATLISNPATTAYLDTGLIAGTTYTYQIAAVDVAGNPSGKTTVITVTTPLLSQAVQRRVIIIPEGAPATKRNFSGTVEFLDPVNLTNKVFQGSVTTDSLGRYTMSVPSGLISPVTMRMVIPGYLTKLVTNVDLRNVTVLDVSFPTLPAGDFNGDGLINSLDFSYMNGKWSQNDALADINKDGDVNSLDFSFLSNNWLVTGD